MEDAMPFISASAAGGENRCAFLDMIAFSEIGPQLLAASDNGYNVLVGSTPTRPLLFSSYATHPDVFNPALDSTAAGRYQLLFRYFSYYQSLLHLADFSPMSQDLIALQQIRERGALASIDSGDLDHAVFLCSNIWASLPGNHYAQHVNPLTALQTAYASAGGTVAAV
jgi:muramidase (phage lysozyme)